VCGGPDCIKRCQTRSEHMFDHCRTEAMPVSNYSQNKMKSSVVTPLPASSPLRHQRPPFDWLQADLNITAISNSSKMFRCQGQPINEAWKLWLSPVSLCWCRELIHGLLPVLTTHIGRESTQSYKRNCIHIIVYYSHKGNGPRDLWGGAQYLKCVINKLF